MTEERVYKIYRIQFEEDGAAYVGITHRTLEARLAHHARKYIKYWGQGGNAELNARMRNGDVYNARVLAEFTDLKKAAEYEFYQIQMLEKPININGTKKAQAKKYTNFKPTDERMQWRKRKPKARKEGQFRCCWCKQNKYAHEFGSDQTRWNGLNSRCKDCVSAYRKAIREARKNGECPSEAYYAAKAKLQVEFPW